MNDFKFVIDIIDNEQEGRFVYEEPSKLFDLYYEASEIYECGESEKAIQKLRYILRKDPTFFPALNDLGWSFLEKNKYLKAKEYFEKALNISEKIIPKHFDGKIIWGHVDNRAFLRILNGLGLVFAYSHKYKDAIKIFERILRYNPNDNQGICYLLGDLYFMSDDFQKAEELFNDNLDSPHSMYSYGLLLYNTKRYTEAIVQFTLGIIEDEYTYKVLINEKYTEPIDHYVASKINDAIEYYSFTFNLWYGNNGQLFLKQIFHSDTFILYYGEILKLRKKLKEVDGVSQIAIETRTLCINRISEIINTIDNDFALKVFHEINIVSS